LALLGARGVEPRPDGVHDPAAAGQPEGRGVPRVARGAPDAGGHLRHLRPPTQEVKEEEGVGKIKTRMSRPAGSAFGEIEESGTDTLGFVGGSSRRRRERGSGGGGGESRRRKGEESARTVRQCFLSAGPAARWIAPSTPPPPSMRSFAAFTCAAGPHAR
jgi:hypothetical protein